MGATSKTSKVYRLTEVTTDSLGTRYGWVMRFPSRSAARAAKRAIEKRLNPPPCITLVITSEPK